MQRVPSMPAFVGSKVIFLAARLAFWFVALVWVASGSCGVVVKALTGMAVWASVYNICEQGCIQRDCRVRRTRTNNSVSVYVCRSFHIAVHLMLMWKRCPPPASTHSSLLVSATRDPCGHKRRFAAMWPFCIQQQLTRVVELLCRTT
jgi:hypothetical protein